MTSLFLWFSLLFPRLTLLICFLAGEMPANETHILIDVFGAILFPRALIAYWIYDTYPTISPMWVVVFVVLQLMESTTGTKKSSAVSNRRST